jgi:hypothetical protein
MDPATPFAARQKRIGHVIGGDDDGHLADPFGMVGAVRGA